VSVTEGESPDSGARSSRPRIIWRFVAAGLLACALVFAYTRSSRVFHALLVSRVVSDHANIVDLDSLQKRLRSGDIPNLHSMLVIQHEQIIAEWYFEGTDEELGKPLGVVKFGPATLHDVRSVTKSIVSLLFGIAMADHAISSLDSPVLDFFPEYKDLQTVERRKIRLRDLLPMTSGLHWDESSYPYTDIRNGETAMNIAPDRYRYILSQPIDSPPGTQWRYSGGDVALIAAVIARTTKTPIDIYAGNKLFRPLGITEFVWIKDYDGIPIAASGLRMLPRDMAKIGLLVLHNGRAPSGYQIVPKSWIRESTSPHMIAFKDNSCTIKYGYFWWLGTGCKSPWYSAQGNGGQHIRVVPSLDMVIVTTAGLYNLRVSNRVYEMLNEEVDRLEHVSPH
jgi:CubicO group peptidase (beta-lactamase class C family)